MNLSRKTILVIVTTFIALIFIVAVTSDIILLEGFANLERQVLRDNVKKVTNEIEKSFIELSASAKDYADSFQQGGAQEINALGINSFATHRIDFIASFKVSGELIAAKAADFHGGRNLELSNGQLMTLQRATRFIIDQSGSRQWHGYLGLGQNVSQIAIRPLNSGSVILVGKVLDREELRRVSDLTKFAIDSVPFGAEMQSEDFSRAQRNLTGGADFFAEVLDNAHIAGFVLCRDIFDQPILLLKVTDKRLVYEQGKVSIAYVVLALVISGAVFCGVMLLFIRKTVLKRLASLSTTVGAISRNRDISARLDVHGEDELGALAVSVNTMLESLESAEQFLKESEERYRALFERAPDSIIIIGTEGEENGRIVDANAAAASQHGYSIAELCSLKIQDLNTPEANLVAGGIMERVANGEWVTSELWHFKKDGTRFPIEVHAGPLTIQGRRYILGFDRDITVRKLVEESDRMYLEQIRQLNAELARQAADLVMANRELESFNYSVSHDMRGPLTRISGYCQLMLEDGSGVSAQTRTYLSRIYESSCWLDEMIGAMLSLARLARADFVTGEVNLSSLCHEQLVSLRQADPGRNVEVVVAEDAVVLGDESLLKILMSNLISNAWKYSARIEQSRIEFGVMPAGEEPVYFVRDNGSGFDMKDVDKLFRAFIRLHDPAQFSGCGIGLATVHRIVARHGGRIWAEGETGHGATFYFTLATEFQRG